MTIKYREATEDDKDFCERLHHHGMRPYVTEAWGWDESFQHARFERLWNVSLVEIFSFKGEDIGYLEIVEAEDSLKLNNFFVKDGFRGKGIGTKVLKDLIAKSQDPYKRITLNVMYNNPAKDLYKRLGFKFVRANDKVHEYELVF